MYGRKYDTEDTWNRMKRIILHNRVWSYATKKYEKGCLIEWWSEIDYG